jgi:uracil phosphoribosyltransferase
MTESAQTIIVTHPLVQHKLTLMRRKVTSVAEFRRLLKEISMLLAYEATRNLSVTHVEIETPVQKMPNAPLLDGKKLVLVGILRAGLGIVEGMLEIVPAARVGHIGLYRNHETLEPVEYFFKVPGKLQDRTVIVCDPMLATGHSAVAAIDRLKRSKPGSLKFVCLLACSQGLKTFHDAHPDVPVLTAAVDEKLNEKGYIVPGLGDAGDRLFGTR